jgi:hypothetical protein
LIGLALLIAVVALICRWARGKPTVAKRFGSYLLGGFVLVFLMVESEGGGDCAGDDCGLAAASWILMSAITMLAGIAVSEVSLLWSRQRQARARGLG